ncbi:shikimate kinase [Bacillus sp. JJ1609]|uniref:shikimate kinase n=1 Tax=Bacillus sp. JJ1609 TaxID=3122977 RepID=UPI002FFDFB96
MKAIYLIGFMGAGKTSVSRKLAEALTVSHYDTDHEIIEAAGKSINDIFASEGEAKFREIESAVLKTMPQHDAVIATGGGIVVAEENRRQMKSSGTVIFLYAEIGEILQRLEGDNSRPLLKENKLEAAQSLYISRLPIYRQTAHIEIDTTSKSVSDIVKEIIVSMN